MSKTVSCPSFCRRKGREGAGGRAPRVDRRVQRLAHVEGRLLPELLQEEAPEGGHGPGEGEDKDNEERYRGEQHRLVLHKDRQEGRRGFVLREDVVDGQGERPRLGKARPGLEEKHEQGEEQARTAGVEGGAGRRRGYCCSAPGRGEERGAGEERARTAGLEEGREVRERLSWAPQAGAGFDQSFH